MKILTLCDEIHLRLLVITVLVAMANGATIVPSNTTSAQFKLLLESAADNDTFIIVANNQPVNGTITITKSVKIIGELGTNILGCLPNTLFSVNSGKLSMLNLSLSECGISINNAAVNLTVPMTYSNGATAVVGQNSDVVISGTMDINLAATALKLTGGTLKMSHMAIQGNSANSVLVDLKNVDVTWTAVEPFTDISNSISIDSCTISFDEVNFSWQHTASARVGGISITNSHGTLSVADFYVAQHSPAISTNPGIFNVINSDITITNASFTSALNLSSMYFDHSTVTISGCFFENNTAPSGGVIFASESTIYFSDTVFSGNSATEGGAIALDGGYYYINNCTIQNNQAQRGGGVSIASGQLVIDKSNLSNNSAFSQGGAIYVSSEGISSIYLLVTNSNIKENAAKESHAIFQTSQFSVMVVRNSSIQEGRPQTTQGDYCCGAQTTASPNGLTCSFPACNSSVCINAVGCSCPFSNTHIDINNPPLITNDRIGCNCSSQHTGLFCTDAPTCKKCVNGVCTAPEICTCSPGWTGIACDAQPVPLLVQTSAVSPNVTFSALRKTNETHPIEFGVTVASISEINKLGEVASTVDLQQVLYNLTTVLGNSSQPNDMWVYRGTLGNGANVSVTFIAINEPGGTYFQQFDNEYFVEGSLKVNVAIYKWPFMTFNGHLHVNFTLDVVGNKKPRMCSQKQSIGDSFFGAEVTFGDSTIYAQFQPKAIIDGTLQYVNFSSSTDYRIVTAIIPQFHDSIILDPNYALLEDYRECAVHPINKLLVICISVPLGALVIFSITLYCIWERRNVLTRKERARNKEIKKEKKKEKKEKKEREKKEKFAPVEMSSQYSLGFDWGAVEETPT